MTITCLLVALGVIAFLLGALANAKADQRRMDRLIRDLTMEVQPDLSEAEANIVQLNPEGFLSGLNEDMRKAIQREEIAAKIEAWQNSDCAGPLPEFLGMSDDEYAAIVEKGEQEGLWEKVEADPRNQSRKSA